MCTSAKVPKQCAVCDGPLPHHHQRVELIPQKWDTPPQGHACFSPLLPSSCLQNEHTNEAKIRDPDATTLGNQFCGPLTQQTISKQISGDEVVLLERY